MDKINQIWPEWQAEKLLGTGSFGKVYKARREKMGHVSYAAIKVIELPQEMSEVKNLRTSGMDNSSIHLYYKDLIKDLMNEISVMESLKTANNIVAIEDYEVVEKKDEFGWILLIRMELLQNLGEYLESHTMTEKEVIRLGIDICHALSNCEKENIIHRDIKIDNVFINTFGAYKLGDFGISKQLEKTSSAMSQKGTNMYMAPEIYRGEKYGSSVDIYSLGIMLYRILNGGRFPFMPPAPQLLRYDDMEKAMQRRLLGEPVPDIAGINKKLLQIVQKACAFHAAERFSSAGELGRELSQLMTGDVLEIEKRAIHENGKSEIRKVPYEDERTMAAFEQNASEEEWEREVKKAEQEKSKDIYEDERTMAAFEQNASEEEEEKEKEVEKEEQEKISKYGKGKKKWVLAAALVVVLFGSIVTGISLKQRGVLHKIKVKILALGEKESDSVSEEEELEDDSEPINSGDQSVSEVNVVGKIEDVLNSRIEREGDELISINLKLVDESLVNEYYSEEAQRPDEREAGGYEYHDFVNTETKNFSMWLLPGRYLVMLSSYDKDGYEIYSYTKITVLDTETSYDVGTIYAEWKY